MAKVYITHFNNIFFGWQLSISSIITFTTIIFLSMILYYDIVVTYHHRFLPHRLHHSLPRSLCTLSWLCPNHIHSHCHNELGILKLRTFIYLNIFSYRSIWNVRHVNSVCYIPTHRPSCNAWVFAQAPESHTVLSVSHEHEEHLSGHSEV